MEFKKRLHYAKTNAITVEINIGWVGEALVLEGYDIGKTVEKFHGDSDYEYSITVKGNDLEKLYHLNNIDPGKKNELLDTISDKINGNYAYSLFRQYLKDNDIEFEAMLF